MPLSVASLVCPPSLSSRDGRMPPESPLSRGVGSWDGETEKEGGNRGGISRHGTTTGSETSRSRVSHACVPRKTPSKA